MYDRIFWRWQQSSTGEKSQQGAYKEISITDAAVVMSYASKVIIVPGYGLAVAQAQHACHELEKILADKGVDMKYAIHPVAGRMPGHMNVLWLKQMLVTINFRKWNRQMKNFHQPM